MKKLLAVLITIGFMSAPLVVRAEEMAGMKHETADVVDAGNKICPVSGEKIETTGDMGQSVDIEHKGKMYHLCCSMCVKDFKANPDKFAKIADDEVAKEKAEQN